MKAHTVNGFGLMNSLTLERQQQISRWLFIILAVWGVGAAIGSYLGLFGLLPLPWFAALVAIGIILPVTVYYGNPIFRAYIRELSLNDLTIFHLWRIPAALAFFYYGSQQWLPSAFVRNAGWGDLAAGVLVFGVIALPKSNWKYWGFHLFGLADFIVAVGTGLTFSVLQIPEMETIATFPIAIIPLFGVGISGASHIMALDILARKTGETDA